MDTSKSPSQAGPDKITLICPLLIKTAVKKRSTIKTDLFAEQYHREKIDPLGDPLAEIEAAIDFAALAAEVDRIAPRPVSLQGGRPPFPTETMVRILVLKRLYNLSDEQMESSCWTV